MGNPSTTHVPMAGMSTAPPAESSASARPFIFWVLLAFFLFEYIRPEPFVRAKPQMFSLLAFIGLWATSEERIWSRNLTLQASFLVLCGLSVTFAVNNFSAYVVTRIMFGHVVLALAITWLLANRRDFVTGIWFWVILMAYQAVYAITHNGHGQGSTLGDENDLALAINTAVPFAFTGIRVFTGWKKWASVGLVVLFLAAIVASDSRGGFVGLVAVTLYYVLSGRNRLRNIGIGVVGALLFFLALPAEYKKEIESIQDTDSGTAEMRLFFWTASFNMWKAHPVLGVGAGNSSWNVGRYQPKGTAGGLFSGRQYHERDFTMTAVHSAYFQLLAEMGTVGVVIFLMIVGSHFRLLRRLSRLSNQSDDVPVGVRNEADAYAVALGGAMVGFLIAGMFLSVVYYPYVWYFSAFGVAWIRSMEKVGLRLAPPGAPSPT